MKSSPSTNKFSIQIDIPEDLSVYADRNGLHDIFINLLSNAFKFTPEEGRFRSWPVKNGKDALIQIQDTGIGIPADKLQKIFEEFYQVEGSKHGGAGLGLAITKHLVEEHGGKIWVESQVGKGSTLLIHPSHPYGEQP